MAALTADRFMEPVFSLAGRLEQLGELDDGRLHRLFDRSPRRDRADTTPLTSELCRSSGGGALTSSTCEQRGRARSALVRSVACTTRRSPLRSPLRPLGLASSRANALPSLALSADFDCVADEVRPGAMADEWDAEEDEEENEATLLTSLAAAAPPPATGAAPATHAAPCGASGVGTLAEPSLSAATSSPALALAPADVGGIVISGTAVMGRAELRSSPFVVYRLSVPLGNGHVYAYRRYSEFVDLDRKVNRRDIRRDRTAATRSLSTSTER